MDDRSSGANAVQMKMPSTTTRPARPAIRRPATKPRGDQETDKGGRQGPLKPLEKLGAVSVPQPKTNVHTITIVGQIEGHMVLPSQNKTTKYEHILPQLVAIEESKEIEGLLVILNTVGGDVEAGLAIAEMVAGLTKPSVSLILGGGHSIGVPIAVSTDYSFIAPTATMTIHPIRLTGLLIGVPQTYEYLDKMQDRVIKFVVKQSKIREERFRELMFNTGGLARDIGTVLVGKDAVSEGLINAVGGIGEALARLHGLIKAWKMETGRPSGAKVSADPGQPDLPAVPAFQSPTGGWQQ